MTTNELKIKLHEMVYRYVMDYCSAIQRGDNLEAITVSSHSLRMIESYIDLLIAYAKLEYKNGNTE